MNAARPWVLRCAASPEAATTSPPGTRPPTAKKAANARPRATERTASGRGCGGTSRVLTTTVSVTIWAIPNSARRLGLTLTIGGGASGTVALAPAGVDADSGRCVSTSGAVSRRTTQTITAQPTTKTAASNGTGLTRRAMPAIANAARAGSATWMAGMRHGRQSPVRRPVPRAAATTTRDVATPAGPGSTKWTSTATDATANPSSRASSRFSMAACYATEAAVPGSRTKPQRTNLRHLAPDPLRLTRNPRQKLRARAGVQDAFRRQPGRAGHRGPPSEVIEFFGSVGVRVDREDAAELCGSAGSNVREIEPLVRTVQLQRGAGAGGFPEDEIPIEVQIIARSDVAPGGMGDDVDVGIADPDERPGRQLLARLAARDVDGSDHQVVASQYLVRIVEAGVGADLKLAAVEQPKALRRSLGRGRSVGLLTGETLVECRHDSPLRLHPFDREAAGNRQTDGVVGQHEVGVAAASGGLRHLLDGVDAVRPVGVAVAIAPQIGARHEHRKRPRVTGLYLAAILAQFRLDERQAQETIGLPLGREGPEFRAVARRILARRILAVVAQAQVSLLGQTPAAVASDPPQPDVVFLRPCEMDQVSAHLAGRHDHQIHLRPAQKSDGGLVRPLRQNRLNGRQPDEPRH